MQSFHLIAFTCTLLNFHLCHSLPFFDGRLPLNYLGGGLFQLAPKVNPYQEISQEESIGLLEDRQYSQQEMGEFHTFPDPEESFSPYTFFRVEPRPQFFIPYHRMRVPKRQLKKRCHSKSLNYRNQRGKHNKKNPLSLLRLDNSPVLKAPSPQLSVRHPNSDDSSIEETLYSKQEQPLECYCCCRQKEDKRHDLLLPADSDVGSFDFQSQYTPEGNCFGFSDCKDSESCECNYLEILPGTEYVSSGNSKKNLYQFFEDVKNSIESRKANRMISDSSIIGSSNSNKILPLSEQKNPEEPSDSDNSECGGKLSSTLPIDVQSVPKGLVGQQHFLQENDVDLTIRDKINNTNNNSSLFIKKNDSMDGENISTFLNKLVKSNQLEDSVKIKNQNSVQSKASTKGSMNPPRTLSTTADDGDSIYLNEDLSEEDMQVQSGKGLGLVKDISDFNLGSSMINETRYQTVRINVDTNDELTTNKLEHTSVQPLIALASNVIHKSEEVPILYSPVTSTYITGEINELSSEKDHSVFSDESSTNFPTVYNRLEDANDNQNFSGMIATSPVLNEDLGYQNTGMTTLHSLDNESYVGVGKKTVKYDETDLHNSNGNNDSLHENSERYTTHSTKSLSLNEQHNETPSGAFKKEEEIPTLNISENLENILEISNEEPNQPYTNYGNAKSDTVHRDSSNFTVTLKAHKNSDEPLELIAIHKEGSTQSTSNILEMGPNQIYSNQLPENAMEPPDNPFNVTRKLQHMEKIKQIQSKKIEEEVFYKKEQANYQPKIIEIVLSPLENGQFNGDESELIHGYNTSDMVRDSTPDINDLGITVSAQDSSHFNSVYGNERNNEIGHISLNANLQSVHNTPIGKVVEDVSTRSDPFSLTGENNENIGNGILRNETLNVKNISEQELKKNNVDNHKASNNETSKSGVVSPNSSSEEVVFYDDPEYTNVKVTKTTTDEVSTQSHLLIDSSMHQELQTTKVGIQVLADDETVSDELSNSHPVVKENVSSNFQASPQYYTTPMIASMGHPNELQWISPQNVSDPKETPNGEKIVGFPNVSEEYIDINKEDSTIQVSSSNIEKMNNYETTSDVSDKLDLGQTTTMFTPYIEETYPSLAASKIFKDHMHTTAQFHQSNKNDGGSYPSFLAANQSLTSSSLRYDSTEESTESIYSHGNLKKVAELQGLNISSIVTEEPPATSIIYYIGNSTNSVTILKFPIEKDVMNFESGSKKSEQAQELHYQDRTKIKKLAVSEDTLYFPGESTTLSFGVSSRLYFQDANQKGNMVGFPSLGVGDGQIQPDDVQSSISAIGKDQDMKAKSTDSNIKLTESQLGENTMHFIASAPEKLEERVNEAVPTPVNVYPQKIKKISFEIDKIDQTLGPPSNLTVFGNRLSNPLNQKELTLKHDNLDKQDVENEMYSITPHSEYTLSEVSTTTSQLLDIQDSQSLSKDKFDPEVKLDQENVRNRSYIHADEKSFSFDNSLGSALINSSSHPEYPLNPNYFRDADENESNSGFTQVNEVKGMKTECISNLSKTLDLNVEDTTKKNKVEYLMSSLSAILDNYQSETEEKGLGRQCDCSSLSKICEEYVLQRLKIIRSMIEQLKDEM